MPEEITWPEIVAIIGSAIFKEFHPKLGKNWEVPINISLVGRVVSHQGEPRSELSFKNFPKFEDAIIKSKHS